MEGNLQLLKSKRSQVTIFIIIAVVLVALVAGFFILRGNLVVSKVPASLEPAYNSFLSCLEQDTQTGLSILGSRGGYIYLPDFDPGSAYLPFSSQLDFLGTPIPYWYYISGNNIQKDQVPSRADMEEQLSQFIEEKIRECNLDDYYEQGIEFVMDTPKANVKINDNSVDVNLDMVVLLSKGDDTSKVVSHDINVKSNFGELYNEAKKIYDYEQKTLFLEGYGVDVLRLYAPVDGTELTCSPKIWNADDVFDELENAIEANTLALKVNNKNYELQNKEDKYFVVPYSTDKDVRFLNSKTWAHYFEVDPAEGNVLIGYPVGNQPGLGVLGFCYVPYHFVYNLRYPVLVQIYDSKDLGIQSEMFQFPISIVIQGNKEREPIEGVAIDLGVPDLCQYKNTQVNVKTYNMNLEPIDTNISFECLGAQCNIGETKSGSLSEKFPQCANGYILADASGYRQGKYLYSTIQSGTAEIYLDKVYDLGFELQIDGVPYNGQAIITFISDKDSATIVYPDQKEVKLSEGQYEITANIYRESQLRLAESSNKKCIDVPRPGLMGVLGFTDEKCFDFEMPEQLVSNALTAGGKQNYYILDSELANARKVVINAPSLPSPSTLEQLQENYILFEQNNLQIIFQ